MANGKPGRPPTKSTSIANAGLVRMPARHEPCVRPKKAHPYPKTAKK